VLPIAGGGNVIKINQKRSARDLFGLASVSTGRPSAVSPGNRRGGSPGSKSGSGKGLAKAKEPPREDVRIVPLTQCLDAPLEACTLLTVACALCVAQVRIVPLFGELIERAEKMLQHDVKLRERLARHMRHAAGNVSGLERKLGIHADDGASAEPSMAPPRHHQRADDAPAPTDAGVMPLSSLRGSDLPLEKAVAATAVAATAVAAEVLDVEVTMADDVGDGESVNYTDDDSDDDDDDVESAASA
jgi:hypothetical protein